MTVSTASSAYRSAPQVRPPNAARIQKDNAQIATAQRARDNTATQKAVAALRRDTPSPQTERPERPVADHDRDAARLQAQAAQQTQTRERVGSALNVKA